MDSSNKNLKSKSDDLENLETQQKELFGELAEEQVEAEKALKEGKEWSAVEGAQDKSEE